MHEAKWSRAEVDADKRRTGGSTFRAAISNARNERTSRLWARAALFEHAAAPGQARGAGSSGTRRPFCGSRASSSGTRPAFCASGVAGAAPVEHSAAPGQTREAPVEYSAAPGRARAAISSHLRLQARLERPYTANSGISRAKPGHARSPRASRSEARKCEPVHNMHEAR